MPRHAKLEIETNAQGTEANNQAVFGTPFFLPAIEVGMQPAPSPLNRDDEQRGIDGALELAPNEYAPEGSINIRNYVNTLGAILYVQIGDVTTTPGDGVITDPDGNTIPSGAYRHVFSKKPGVTPRSARLTTNYGATFFEARGVTVPQLGLTIEEDGVKAAATLMANYMRRLAADPGDGDPTDYDAFAILPMRRRNVKLTWGIGSALMESVELTLEQSLEYVRDLGSATGWPSATERANSPEGFLRLTGSITRRQLDNADWDALVESDSFAVECSMISEQDIAGTGGSGSGSGSGSGGGGYPYGMWIEAPKAQYASGDLETLKNQARHQYQLDWRASYDDVTGKEFTVTVVNDVPAYK